MGKHADPSGSDTNDDDHRTRGKKRRGSRRVTVAGTGPNTATGPEPRIDSIQPETKQTKNKASKLSERERWMLEQRPPHY